MGRDLYQHQLAFRRSLDQCAEGLLQLGSTDIRAALFSNAVDPKEFNQTQLVQPLLFSVCYSLASLWMAFGIQPSALIGLSLGEYVAAAIAGVFSLEDALLLVLKRGELLQGLPSGSMLLVSAPEHELSDVLPRDVRVAAIMSPKSVLVAGASDAIAEFCAVLDRKQTPWHRLRTDKAFHSPAMQPAAAALVKLIEPMVRNPPAIPFVSNLTGRWITDGEATSPSYWAEQLVNPVRLSSGVQLLQERFDPLWLEVGPGQTRSQAVRALPGINRRSVLRTLPAMAGASPEPKEFARNLAELWASGVDVDWQGGSPSVGRRRVPLPGYPFEGQTYCASRPVAGQTELLSTHRSVRPSASEMLWVPTWTHRDRPLGREDERGTWFIFGPASDTCALSLELASDARRVICIAPGVAFTRDEAAGFVIDPVREDDYRRVFQAVCGSGRLEGSVNVVSFSSFWSQNVGLEGNNVSERRLEQSVDVVMGGAYLIRAIASLNATGIPKVSFITHNPWPKTGSEHAPDDALLLGFSLVARREYGELQLRCIDVPKESIDDSLDFVPRCLVPELSSPSTDELVRFEAGQRMVRSIEPIGSGHDLDRPLLRQNGVYLITGGLGAVPSELAKHLAQTVGARLALLSRSATAHQRVRSHQCHPPSSIQGPSESQGVEPAPDLLSSLEQDLDGLCAAYLYGLFTGSPNIAVGQRLALDALIRVLPASSRHRRFLQSALAHLERHGLIRRGLGFIEFVAPPSEGNTSAQLQARLRQRAPAIAGLLDLLEKCAQSWPGVLRGSRTGISVLFEDGDAQQFRTMISPLVELSGSPDCARRLASELRTLASERGGEPLRILEVGAGTGILTAVLVRALRDCNIQYTVTDIGSNFIIDARKRLAPLATHEYRFELLDASRDATAQGFSPESFDVVVALDVLHATPDLQRTIAHLRALLRPGGKLCAIELVKRSSVLDFIWGLTDGWWSFTDARALHGSPISTLDEWQKLLASEPFAQTNTYTAGVPSRARYALFMCTSHHEDIRSASSPGTAAVTPLLDELSEAGAETLILNADVSDETQMRAALATVQQAFGRLDGVIHAAGLAAGSIIATLRRSDVLCELRPKVLGTLVLEKILQDTPIDFMALCSSIGSISGGVGQAGYCAASAFLDARAHANHAGAYSTIAINWPLWGELGTAEPVQRHHRELTGERFRRDTITSAEGVEAFREALRLRAGQIIVSPLDMQELASELNRVGATANGESSEPVRKDKHGRPNLAVDYSAPVDELEERIAAIWSDSLGLEQVGRHDSFFDLGGDSLVGLKIIARLRDVEKVDFRVATLFEKPTVAGVATWIRNQSLQESGLDEVARLKRGRRRR
jgi:malonyl CoA-acyl carrier protein transacylase/ubiquinone/menaquinone biosynthesis C-methylase UbiE